MAFLLAWKWLCWMYMFPAPSLFCRDTSHPTFRVQCSSALICWHWVFFTEQALSELLRFWVCTIWRWGASASTGPRNKRTKAIVQLSTPTWQLPRKREKLTDSRNCQSDAFQFAVLVHSVTMQTPYVFVLLFFPFLDISRSCRGSGRLEA